MADVRPFRALHYNPDVVPDVATVLPTVPASAPSDLLAYDRDRSPFAFRRLEPGLVPHPDAPRLHEQAGRTLRSWIRNGTLTHLPQPAFLRLEQRFVLHGAPMVRTGVIGRVRLHDYGDRVILPHERTLRAPRLSRTDLLRSTHAQFSPIYFLYGDPELSLERTLSTAPERPPLCAWQDRDDVLHTIHVLDEPGVVNAIATTFRERQLLIADGHHRYEAALALRRESTTTGADTDWIMGFLANAHAPDTVVQPTHRILRGLPGFRTDRFVEQLRALFSLEEVDAPLEQPALQPLLDDTETLLLALADTPGARPRLLRLHPRRDRVAEAIRRHRLPPVAERIPLLLLHDLILPRLANLSVREQETTSHILHTHALAEVREALGHPDTHFAALPGRLAIDPLLEIGNAGLFLPQKSTYFFPKVPPGLAMLDLHLP
ncbi:MAG: DUF1015 family protein [Deltaproteobacteria bacterium]|nr:MAG: DUF1015 family protein [Deltaproteobacteria bacterium]